MRLVEDPLIRERMEIQMTLWKRMLSMFLCLILCIVPALMMVSAAENTVAVCEHPSWIPHYSTAANRYVWIAATEDNCPGYQYVGCLCTCTTCGYQEQRTVYQNPVSHTNELVMIDGEYKHRCTNCYYISSPIILLSE